MSRETLIAAATRRGRTGGRSVLRVVRRLLAAAGVALLVWAGGLVWFAETIRRSVPPEEPGAPAEQTDAIVVLTGGRGRVATGLALLAEGRGTKLFVSGVYKSVEVGELLGRARISAEGLECCIILGYAAESTTGNALETAAWMRDQGFSSLRLVTANYHMPRSLLEFRMALPEIRIVPHPVASPNVPLDAWWQRRGTARLIMTEYNKYLIVLLRHLAGPIGELWAPA